MLDDDHLTPTQETKEKETPKKTEADPAAQGTAPGTREATRRRSKRRRASSVRIYLNSLTSS